MLMYIGKLAKLTGATPKAIRHYESIGLIPIPRRKGRYRIYSESDIHLLKMIRQAQTVGFSLAELAGLAAAKSATGKFPLELANKLFSGKYEQLQKRICEIEDLKKSLKSLQKELNLLYGLAS